MTDVYLNKRAMRKDGHRVYSLREKGKVFSKSHYVLMENVEFVVQEAGRLETLSRLNGKTHPSFSSKTVHAFLRGTVLNFGERAWRKGRNLGLLNGDIVNYDPIFMDKFSIESREVAPGALPILCARLALCHKYHIHILQ